MMIEHIYRLQWGVDAGMAVLIWLVQVVIYPSYRSIVPEKFHDWHLQYMKTISRVVIPLMFLQVLCHGLLVFHQPSLIQWLAISAIAGAWIVTSALSVPCHKKLQSSGFRIEVINRLIHTNWLRTFFWSITFILSAFISALS